MGDSIYSKWKANKPLLIGSLIFLGVIGFILVQTIYSFLNLQKIQGKILSVKIDKQSGTYLTIKLEGDNKIYYQEYEKRFFDPEILKLHQNDELFFFTFQDPVKKRAAISSLGDQSSFLYWPVFNVNKEAGILQLFYFYLYNNYIIILLAISWVLVLYNGFYIFLKANWISKAVLILFNILIVWLLF